MGVRITQRTADKYERLLRYLKQYLAQRGKAEDIPVERMNYEFLDGFNLFLQTAHRCRHNGAGAVMDCLRNFVLYCLRNEWITKNPFRYYKLKEDEVQAKEHLTAHELELLTRKELDHRLARIRDVFVFCCLTGLAFADADHLRREHLSQDDEGRWWIHKPREKTSVMSRIPLLPASLEILRRGLKVAWWTNIRFEKNFTGDLAQLMSAAGCIAVSGGLEVASDRLLALMDKGVTIEQATLAMRNFFYAGIMVHPYLMYGFPTQTLQESVDALEVVRQLFRAELIGSAFWHRYAMTVHSPSGIDPEKYGVHRKNKGPNGFANNEVPFTEIRTYNINTVGEALNEALTNYMCGGGIDRPAHKWFKGKEIPPTTLENTLITDQLIKPDASRIYNDPARLVWIGVPLIRTGEGVTARNNTGEKQFRFGEAEAEFLMELTLRCADLSRKVTLADAKQLYGKYSPEPFVVFYHSKQWDQLRKYGLLQI